jgi:preprotein translocase subunit SecG
VSDRLELGLTSELILLGAMSTMATTLMIALFLAVCIAMILVVLIQRPQGGGLSGAFGAGGGGGSSGAGQTAFGTKTGDVLTYATIGVFILFVVLAIVLNFATRPPEPSDNTPSIVAPGTARETVDDSEGSDDGAVEETVEEAVDGAADSIEDAGEEVVEDITGDPVDTDTPEPAADVPEPSDIPSDD